MLSGGDAAPMSVSGSKGGDHHFGDKRYKDARVIDGWKVRSSLREQNPSWVCV